MKQVLDFIQWKNIKRLYRSEKKKVPYYKTIADEFFHSKNGRLAVMLIIAAMIPLTVIGSERVQILQQQAKETNQCTDASYPLQVFPNPAKDGESITFKHADSPTTQSEFENDDFTGNGAVGCALDGGVIKCTAKYNSKSGKPQSDHTYEVHGNKCNYSVLKPETKPKQPKDPNATRDPNKPTATPKPSKPQPTRKASAGFDVDIKADGCNADKVPRLKVKWDLSGKTKDCKVNISGGGQTQDFTTEGKDGKKNACGDESFTLESLPKDSKNSLKVKTEYTIIISGTGDDGIPKKNEAKATTNACDTPNEGRPDLGTPKPSPKPNPTKNPTATPKPREQVGVTNTPCGTTSSDAAARGLSLEELQNEVTPCPSTSSKQTTCSINTVSDKDITCDPDYNNRDKFALHFNISNYQEGNRCLITYGNTTVISGTSAKECTRNMATTVMFGNIKPGQSGNVSLKITNGGNTVCSAEQNVTHKCVEITPRPTRPFVSPGAATPTRAYQF